MVAAEVSESGGIGKVYDVYLPALADLSFLVLAALISCIYQLQQDNNSGCFELI